MPSQNTRITNTHTGTHRATVKSIQNTTKCNYLTKLLAEVADDKRLNINIQCTVHNT